jgi:hypothetical protein
MKKCLPLLGVLLCSCTTNEFSVGMPLGLTDQKIDFLTVHDLPDVDNNGYENLSSAQQGLNFRWEGIDWLGQNSLIVELSPFAGQNIGVQVVTNVGGGQDEWSEEVDLKGARYSLGMRHYWYPGEGLYVESMLGLLSGYQVTAAGEPNIDLDPAIVLSLGLGYKFSVAPESPFFFDCRAIYDIPLTPLVYDPINDTLFDTLLEDSQLEVTSSGATVSVGFGFSF